MAMWEPLLEQIKSGDVKAIARGISLVENESGNYQQLLRALPSSTKPIIGITGPPGAGKSTLADALIKELVRQNKKVAVLCVDPSSPFRQGALLGDRIRMSEWYNHPAVFIRSLASRGTLGGLHPKIIEITDLLKASPYDYIIVETVGVGQSEVEIAGLADLTIVVLVPESGDEIQAMKAGLMEIADIFVVNKSDRPEADSFANNLRQLLPGGESPTPIIKTIATSHKGIDQLTAAINKQLSSFAAGQKRFLLMAEKAWQLIIHKRMQPLNKDQIADEIKLEMGKTDFNLYRFADRF